MEVPALLAAAAAGDRSAWDALVERFSGMMWGIARSYRLSESDAGDMVQFAWLRLLENLDRVREPERLAGWLATTVRRECLQHLRRARVAELPVEEVDVAATAPDHDTALITAERDAALWAAVGVLSELCQRLLRALMASPPPSYAEVSGLLGVPVGGIGPTRQRCLAKLRDALGAVWTEDW